MGVAGAGGVDLNARVMSVLAQIGLTGASELPDGSIRLPDGRIIGELSLGGDQETGNTGEKSRGGVGAGASRTLQGLPASVRRMVEALEAEVRGCKKKVQVFCQPCGQGVYMGRAQPVDATSASVAQKIYAFPPTSCMLPTVLQEQKKEVAEMYDQMKARRAAFAQNETESKRREAEMAGRLAVAQARLCEVREAAAKTKEEQLAAVLAESRVVSDAYLKIRCVRWTWWYA